MKIKGGYIDNEETTKGEWTPKEINQMLQNGHEAMLIVQGYYIDTKKHYVMATGLTLFENETFIGEDEEFLVVPTFFQERMLPSSYHTGDSTRLTKVNCLIPKEDKPFIVISKKQKAI